MADTQSPFPEAFLQDVFEAVRDAGLKLTLDQYELLSKAVKKGYGLSGWNDLKRICRLLWVKPNNAYDSDVFDKAFDDYLYRHQLDSFADKETTESDSSEPEKSVVSSLPLPKVPPRKATAQPSDNIGEIPTAVKVEALEQLLSPHHRFVLHPRTLPLEMTDARSHSQALRQPIPVPSREPILDLDATIDRILQEGVFDVVLRPVMMPQAELLLLIDDANTMNPFRLAIQPLINAVEERHLRPATIYRFTCVPGEHLYRWRPSTASVPVSTILKRVHQNRTIAIIWSDAGAATHKYDELYVTSIYRFLQRLAPCVRSLIWLNPLPKDRWIYSSAHDVSGILNGRMLHLESSMWSELSRQNRSGKVIQLRPPSIIASGYRRLV